MEITPIATFHSPFASKFGMPKQSGLVSALCGEIIFEPPFRNRDVLRGIESFDYLWLIWGFSGNGERHGFSPLVRPPLLGGNTRMGVFATRSPFRPNPLGLSSVRLDHIEERPCGPVIVVRGADLMDGTPIYDIKPYVTFVDSHADARSGFVDTHPLKRLQVVFPDEFAQKRDADELRLLRQILELDPRPHYQHDAERVYGMTFNDEDIHFRVEADTLYVLD